MRKTKKKNRLQKTIDELTSILDKDYFHVSIEIKDQDKVEWSVYYKNLPENAYFSRKNKPLLTSKKNGITDIHLLNEKFEKEKNKESMQHLKEIIQIISAANRSAWNMRDYFLTFYTCVSILIVLLLITNAVLIHSFVFSIILLLVTVATGIFSIQCQDKMINESSKMAKNIENVYMKEKIKHLGFYFVERIKIRKD